MSELMSQGSAKSQRKNGVAPKQEMRLLGAEISNEAIAKRAYEKFEARGCVDGRDREDWGQAQDELLAEANKS
jgi:hypothetical protein